MTQFICVIIIQSSNINIEFAFKCHEVIFNSISGFYLVNRNVLIIYIS